MFPLRFVADLIRTGRLNNRAFRITPDLSTVRSNTSLTTEGTLPIKDAVGDTILRWVYLKVVTKGTGTFTLKFRFQDGSTVSVASSEMEDGDEFTLEFVDLLLTNASQSVTNPTFWVESHFVHGEPA